MRRRSGILGLVAVIIGLAVAPLCPAPIQAADAPTPLLKRGQPVDWWFMLKLNSAIFPGCGPGPARACIFGGEVQKYRGFGQQFVYASKNKPSLEQGSGCAGDSINDPMGATFDEVYNGSYNYVIWNDQFYDDPEIQGCTNSCSGPWGHSKGLLAWSDDGEGFVLQVTTPSWPAAGSKAHPRENDGNTLGCVTDNNVLVSQHFFALKVNREDIAKILKALRNASVVTDTANSQIVNVSGPSDLKTLVGQLGKKSASATVTKDTLSSGVVLISKPSALHVPPWQMISAELDGVSLRAATWWAKPQIYSTTASTPIGCWDDKLAQPGAVEIAISGQWDGKAFGLAGGLGGNFNHAKIGVSTSGGTHYTIFGDMNQQGSWLAGQNCASSQNGRGGVFYVLDDADLFEDVTNLLAGNSAPTTPPKVRSAKKGRARKKN
jgi:hypothetical protein